MPDDLTPDQRAATLLDLAGLPTDDVLVGRVATAIRAAEARGERRGAERERASMVHFFATYLEDLAECERAQGNHDMAEAFEALAPNIRGFPWEPTT